MKIAFTKDEYKALKKIAMNCSFEQIKSLKERFNPKYVKVEELKDGSVTLEYNSQYMSEGLDVVAKYLPAMVFNLMGTIRLYQQMDDDFDVFLKKWERHFKIMSAPTISMEELDNLDKPSKK